MAVISFVINGKQRYEFERPARVPGVLQARVQLLEQKLNEGLDVDGYLVSDPGREQKIQFILPRLLLALEKGDRELLETLCTWLAEAAPTLSKVNVTDSNGQLDVELS